MNHQEIALQLIEETLHELESTKGSLLTAINKLNRAATILDNQEVQIWCAIQLGERKFTSKLKELVELYTKKPKPKNIDKLINDKFDELESIGININKHAKSEELTFKANEGSGGFANIGFIEDRYADLVRTKRGNDGTYYKNNLNKHLNYIKKIAHNYASDFFNQLKFSGTISSCFDVMKNAVDDRLLDLDPSLAEQLMLIFKAVSSSNNEEWSQSLTTCRRMLESLADQLYPPSDQKINGRPLGQTQYVNRLWAYMDTAIQSSSNKELAKTHVDFLGSWLEKINKLTNKGVHAEVTQIEAIKTVFHTYLVIADLLEYLETHEEKKTLPNINTATLDELEALLNINRNIAKEIVKTRIKEGKLTLSKLKDIKGIGPKTLASIQEIFILD